MNKKTIVFLVIVILAAAGYWYFYRTPAQPMPKPEPSQTGLTEAEARQIAEQSCIKGGEALTSAGTFNENSKTWWFDANLNSTQPGCNPACVVAAETKEAEINWRCTGLIVPSNELAGEVIRQLFVQKYPTYAETLSVRIDKETDSFVRGGVIFVDGEPGGIFLAAKVNNQWQIVFDGNGAIPCTLSQYGFPADMLADCAE